MSKKICAVLGLSWGDEGKGKICDAIAKNFDIVIRFNGGGNAGHTIVVGENVFKLHHIPSGILYPQIKNVIGRKCVVDFFDVIDEIKSLQQNGIEISPKNLAFSYDSQIVFPHHKKIDIMRENIRGKQKIGTTGRGIGPAYSDFISRVGVTFKDILENNYKEKLQVEVKIFNSIAREFFEEEIKILDVFNRIEENKKFLLSFVQDCYEEIFESFSSKKIMFEGAQGLLLDSYFGTRPFVSSSLSSIHGALLDFGLSFSDFDEIIGVTKLYTTRVGSGSFPTELEDGELKNIIQTRGNEFGATTGRARRCGWLDLCALKSVVKVNGVTSLAITKSDVLDVLSEVKICTSYTNKISKKEIPFYPGSDENLKNVEANYITFEGWKTKTEGLKTKTEIPAQLQTIFNFISESTNTKTSIVSTGFQREDLIFL